MTKTTGKLAARGIFTYDDLAQRAASRRHDQIEGLMTERSINLVVGDSGLGKTPLSMMEGVAVAANKPFLGRSVVPGDVLYCDAESGIGECARTLGAVSRHLGLDRPPENFYLWSPNFDPSIPDPESKVADVLCAQVELVKPALVIVDPLRAFWTDAEENARDAMAMIVRMRRISKEVGCSWTLNHHRRKRNHQHAVRLERDR